MTAGAGRSAPFAMAVFAGGFDRVHYALVMASAAAAIGRPVTLLFSGRAIRALLPAAKDGTPAWYALDRADDGTAAAARDAILRTRGVAGFEELLQACTALGCRFIVCEMALRAWGIPAGAAFRADVPVAVGGIVSFLEAAGDGRVIFV